MMTEAEMETQMAAVILVLVLLGTKMEVVVNGKVSLMLIVIQI